MLNISKAIFYLATLTLLASCKKFTEVDPPKYAISTEQVFSDDQNANAAVLGIYSLMSQMGFGQGRITLETGLSSDELIRLDPGIDDRNIMENNIRPQNGLVLDLWTGGFRIIGQANACIEGLENSNAVSASKKAQLIAECRFLRAYCYFYLTNIFGRLPIVTTTNWTQTTSLSRAQDSEIRDFILSDLMDAYQQLPIKNLSGTKARATKWAATALLARFHLYNRNWNDALRYANLVIDQSTLFTGELPALSTVFLTGSEEAIWQMPPAVTWVNPFEGTAYNNFGQLLYVLSEAFKDSIDQQDKRIQQWVDIVDDGKGNLYAVPSKYKANTYTGTNTEQYVMIRMAEVVLIRAEALAQNNQAQMSVESINIIRRRAALSELPNDLTKAELLVAVEQERRIELFAEWGHRWFDLKRFAARIGSGNRADEILSIQKAGSWQSTDALYPVPQKEISLNPSLAPNNPGY